MSKRKLINTIYKGAFEGMSVAVAEEYYTRAKGNYNDQLAKFERLHGLYKRPDTKGEYDKNIIFELIESEIDNNIYMPKVRSMNGLWEQANALESIIKNNLYDFSYREFNDKQERDTYIFGGSVTYIYWDVLSRNSHVGGKMKFKNIDPRYFIPQHGINDIDSMDYCFLVETTTKMNLSNTYLLGTESLALLESDSEYTIDPDLATVKTMFYKDKFNHVCKFVWCGQIVLEDIENIYVDKLFYCTKCEEVKQADEDTCINCGANTFELKSVDRKNIMVREVRDNENSETGEITQSIHEVPAKVTPYVPNRFPIVIRKNISTNELFGISDAEMIETSQKLNNSILNKLADRVLKSGTLIALPKTLRNKLKIDNSELKLLYYDNPQEANGIITKNLQPPFGNEPYLMDSAYSTARQTLGITNTFQGREDTSAISSKAKEIQVQQTAGRLESKREMKKASLVNMFELMFQFILAYSYEYQGYYVNYNGEDVYKMFDNRLFLKNKDGNYFFDDEYSFDIDLSATLENNREQMWTETRANFETGAYGDKNDINSIKMFWDTMVRLNYPGAKEALEYIEGRMTIQMQERELDEMYKNRELALQQEAQASADLQASEAARVASNQANAKTLESLNK